MIFWRREGYTSAILIAPGRRYVTLMIEEIHHLIRSGLNRVWTLALLHLKKFNVGLVNWWCSLFTVCDLLVFLRETMVVWLFCLHWGLRWGTLQRLLVLLYYWMQWAWPLFFVGTRIATLTLCLVNASFCVLIPEVGWPLLFGRCVSFYLFMHVSGM